TSTVLGSASAGSAVGFVPRGSTPRCRGGDRFLRRAHRVRLIDQESAFREGFAAGLQRRLLGGRSLAGQGLQGRRQSYFAMAQARFKLYHQTAAADQRRNRAALSVAATRRTAAWPAARTGRDAAATA